MTAQAISTPQQLHPRPPGDLGPTPTTKLVERLQAARLNQQKIQLVLSAVGELLSERGLLAHSRGGSDQRIKSPLPKYSPSEKAP